MVKMFEGNENNRVQKGSKKPEKEKRTNGEKTDEKQKGRKRLKRWIK